MIALRDILEGVLGKVTGSSKLCKVLYNSEQTPNELILYYGICFRWE